MAQTAADFMLDRLSEWGVKRIYGIPATASVALAWDGAFGADRPCVIDALTDLNVPPLPPHIKYEQAKGYAEAVLRGDPDALKIIWQSVRKGVKGMVPGV